MSITEDELTATYQRQNPLQGTLLVSSSRLNPNSFQININDNRGIS
jgi:hypothetical protein